MKKLLIVFGLSLMAASAYAACFGPFCYDDTGVSIAGTLFDGNGDGTPLVTKAAINAATPKAKGQEVFCTDCTAFGGSKGYLCISTGTTTGAYMGISSGTAVAGCI